MALDVSAEDIEAELLLAVGTILFLFPEPITSIVGIALVVIGVVLWLGESATEEPAGA